MMNVKKKLNNDPLVKIIIFLMLSFVEKVSSISGFSISGSFT